MNTKELLQSECKKFEANVSACISEEVEWVFPKTPYLGKYGFLMAKTEADLCIKYIPAEPEAIRWIVGRGVGNSYRFVRGGTLASTLEAFTKKV